MANISEWSTTAASNNSASPDGFPENMAPAGLNDSAREVMAAISKWYDDMTGSLTSAGTGAAYTLTTNNAHAALSDIPVTVFVAHTASTLGGSGTAPTLSIDATGAKTIKKRHDVDLAAGDIEAGQLVVVARNATDDTYELISASGGDTDVQRLFSAQGDLIIGATSGTATALAIGSASTILTSDGSTAAWSAPAAVTLPSPDFTSSASTVTLATQLDLPHSLGAAPTLVRVVLKCATTDLGYAVGDEVEWATSVGQGTGSQIVGAAVMADATNITISQAATSIRLPNKSTGADGAITVGNWNWIARAWA